jgi:hypothetical protein
MIFVFFRSVFVVAATATIVGIAIILCIHKGYVKEDCLKTDMYERDGYVKDERYVHKMWYLKMWTFRFCVTAWLNISRVQILMYFKIYIFFKQWLYL